MPATLSLIVACDENRVIGRGGRLVYRLPEDRAWFERHTAGRTLIMGRRCFEAWPEATSGGRRPIVVTSRPDSIPAPAVPAASIDAALALARETPGEIMVCGGQRVYEETLPLADRLYLTLVNGKAEGDRWFPDWRGMPWRETHRHESDADGVRCTYLILERVRPQDIDRCVPGRTHPA